MSLRDEIATRFSEVAWMAAGPEGDREQGPTSSHYHDADMVLEMICAAILDLEIQSPESRMWHLVSPEIEEGYDRAIDDVLTMLKSGREG